MTHKHIFSCAGFNVFEASRTGDWIIVSGNIKKITKDVPFNSFKVYDVDIIVHAYFSEFITARVTYSCERETIQKIAEHYLKTKYGSVLKNFPKFNINIKMRTDV